MPQNQNFLAFDTSTDRLSVALGVGARIWQHNGPGGAMASTTLVPVAMDLLRQADITLGQLDAIAFGRGPGSFTGLRTACAVAQGLAFGAARGKGLPVLPIDTLMAVAEEARWQCLQVSTPLAGPLSVTALLDARMDEIYLQRYAFEASAAGPAWTPWGRCGLLRPENLQPVPGDLLAGNPFTVYADRLPAGLAQAECVDAFPTATALLRLAPALFAAGHAVDAALALPLYVRNKVAFTTDERAEAKARGVAPGTPSPTPFSP